MGSMGEEKTDPSAHDFQKQDPRPDPVCGVQRGEILIGPKPFTMASNAKGPRLQPMSWRPVRFSKSAASSKTQSPNTTFRATADQRERRLYVVPLWCLYGMAGGTTSSAAAGTPAESAPGWQQGQLAEF